MNRKLVSVTGAHPKCVEKEIVGEVFVCNKMLLVSQPQGLVLKELDEKTKTTITPKISLHKEYY